LSLTKVGIVIWIVMSNAGVADCADWFGQRLFDACANDLNSPPTKRQPRMLRRRHAEFHRCLSIRRRFHPATGKSVARRSSAIQEISGHGL